MSNQKFANLGTKNGKSKLNEKQVLAIRKSPEKLMYLSAVYGVSEPTISDIKRKITWKHL